ncbi:MAG: pirin family protein [Candidatus Lambdaproteobacteria bacterium]|nr:pirin family protein [Candidatus Lambdaproteobacteria bacterium]
MRSHDDAVLDVAPLGSPWQTPDPFLFCVYHLDEYPQGNTQMGPAALLAGRAIGMDFEGKDGWRMYHGDVVPGFPRHPHRGFETVTIARRGLIDHSDSLGATARFGGGDAQWMTAGRGIVHAEMFPLVKQDAPNPLELFQIWLNLPAEDKLVAPHFKMLWNESIPTVTVHDAAGRTTAVTVVAGPLGETQAPAPPPKSWAARPDAHVAIWTLRMAPEARWALPAAPDGVNRMLYLFQGSGLRVGERAIAGQSAVLLRQGCDVALQNGDEQAELLLLQGRPIAEPVAQAGPFVMNSRAELMQAYDDYRRTEFGGWPWPSDGPVHARDAGRHARHPDGRLERME